MDVLLRKATSADAAAAWGIRNAAILAQCPGHYPDDLLARWTEGAATDRFARSVAEKWHVATIDEVVVATGIINTETGHVDSIFVRPDLMGQGIGARMMAYLEGIARRAGLTQLTLDSTLNAAAFYRKCGFVGQERCLYHSPRGFALASIPMIKQLAGPSGAD